MMKQRSAEVCLMVFFLFAAFAVEGHCQASCGQSTWKTPQTVRAWGDQGNGTYRNPVLNADFSDPDVIRVGERYYMTASDFHFIGMQILESDDMVNWHLISQVFDRFDLPGWDANNHYAGGSWAPALRYHDGKFWVFFCTPEEGLFMSTATDPHGPWTPLHCVKAVEKWEDPCPFWDDDGNAYLGRSRHRAGPIIVHRMSADGRELLDEGVTVYTGPVAEGTKFLKRGGFYYLIIPEGGVGTGWQTVLRAKSIYGPYEKRVVLEQGTTSINGPHQGALVDTPDGRWFFYHFQSVEPLGRVVHLQPARWVDDWPLMGADLDMNGVGEPVGVWTSPVRNSSVPSLPKTSDEFDGKELHYRGQKLSQLGLQWQWNHNPDDARWSLNERKGWLTLHALAANSLKESRNMLSQKTIGLEGSAEVEIDASGLTDGGRAGIFLTGKAFTGLGILKKNGTFYLYQETEGKDTIVSQLNTPRCVLRIHIDALTNRHQYAYSVNRKLFTSVGQPFAMRSGFWKGIRTGIYCYNTKETTGLARFNYFRYHVLK